MLNGGILQSLEVSFGQRLGSWSRHVVVQSECRQVMAVLQCCRLAWSWHGLDIEVSPCSSLYINLKNLATSRPEQRGFACLPMAPDAQGVNPPGNEGGGRKNQSISSTSAPSKSPNQASSACLPLELASFWTPQHQNWQPWLWNSVLHIMPKDHTCMFHIEISPQCVLLHIMKESRPHGNSLQRGRHQEQSPCCLMPATF